VATAHATDDVVDATRNLRNFDLPIRPF